MLQINKEKSFRSSDVTTSNLIIHGDNLEIMESFLNKEPSGFSEIDFMLWDPPYNTGRNDFAYKDDFKIRYSRDRHSCWMSFMDSRLKIAKQLLKESGIIAIHIGHKELFYLGVLMNDIFGEDNRLAIITWECSCGPKSTKSGLYSTSDYILIYAKHKAKVFRGILPRTAKMDARYKYTDNNLWKWSPDPFVSPVIGRNWCSESITKPSKSLKDRYGIENPLTGKLYYPPVGREWRMPKLKVKDILCGWNISYIVDQNGDVVIAPGQDRSKAQKIQDEKDWPKIFFGMGGGSGPALRRYRDELKNEGCTFGSYWKSEELSDDEYDDPDISNLAFPAEMSEYNGNAKKLIKYILGDDIIFSTPKPLKLTKRLIEMFCPKEGIVLDAFGGSGTTAHAVLELNKEGSSRRFVLIEKESFTDNLTAERIRRVITGEWSHPKKGTTPLEGNFIYMENKPSVVEGQPLLNNQQFYERCHHGKEISQL